MTNSPQGPVGPVQAEPIYQAQRPHRGVLILVLGILGLVCCFILGIIAWVMGSSDLQEMRAGRMDRSGEGLTQAGKICGIISVVLWLLWLVMAIFWSVIAGSAPHFRSV